MALNTIILTYASVIVWSNTVGLSVLSVLNPMIQKKAKEEGYIPNKKKQEDKVQSTTKGVLKFFIPFYYCYQAIKKIDVNGDFEDIIREQVKNKELIPMKKEEYTEPEEKDYFDIKVVELPNIPKYRASSNLEGNSLYAERRETPKIKEQEELNVNSHIGLSPFIESEAKPKVEQLMKKQEEPVQTDIFHEEPKTMVNQTIVSRKATEDDLVDYVMSLDPKELLEVKGSIDKLVKKMGLLNRESPTLNLERDKAA